MEYIGLLDWINLNNLDWDYLSSNPNSIAIYLLSQNIEKINKYSLSENKNIKEFTTKNSICFEFIKKHMNKSNGFDIDQIVKKSDDINIFKLFIEIINWDYLSSNPYAIEILKKNLNNINWSLLSSNPNAIELLEAYPYKINWDYLSSNPNAIKLLEANPKKINWTELSINPNAIELLKANPEKINWPRLCLNPNAIELLKENPEKIDWNYLSSNPNAIDLLKTNIKMVKWCKVCKIRNYKAINLIRNYFDKKNYKYLDWLELSRNPYAIDLLKENQDKIKWNYLSLNPAIFKYNYEYMKESRKDLNEEIISMALNPIRINDLMKKYGRDIVYDTYF
jgi:hypothetical protein